MLKGDHASGLSETAALFGRLDRVLGAPRRTIAALKSRDTAGGVTIESITRGSKIIRAGHIHNLYRGDLIFVVGHRVEVF